MCTNVDTHLDCGENVRTPHGIARVWPEPGKVPTKMVLDYDVLPQI